MPRKFINKDIPSIKPIECNVCGKILSRKATLREHIQDAHKTTKKITCSIGSCNYKTNRIGNYNLHLEKVHKIVLPIFRCYSYGCGKRSKSESAMIKHMRVCRTNKSKFKPIKCTEKNCNEEFLTKNGLETHLLIKHKYSTNEQKEEKEEKEGEEVILLFHREIEELLIV